jgi:GntR family transcriptional regulator
LGLYVATPRQRLNDTERDRRLDEAIQRFVHEVAALDYPPDKALAKLDRELRVLAPKKTA